MQRSTRNKGKYHPCRRFASHAENGFSSLSDILIVQFPLNNGALRLLLGEKRESVPIRKFVKEYLILSRRFPACAAQPFRIVYQQGGTLGHERTSRLDALQAALHGLEEVLTKQRIVDKAARKETRALGGPADIGALLDSNSEHDKGVPAGLVAANGTGGTGEGWVTGAQLKGLEEQIRSRYDSSAVCTRVTGVGAGADGDILYTDDA